MVHTPQDRIRNLRIGAEHCRVLARGALPFRVAQELEEFAADLDADAARLQRSLEPAKHRAPASRRKLPQGCA